MLLPSSHDNQASNHIMPASMVNLHSVSNDYVEIIHLLYKSINQAVVAVLVAAVLMTYFHFAIYPASMMYTWIGYMFAVAALRVISKVLFFRRLPQGKEIKIWANVFVLFAALIGVGWGVAAYLFLNPQYPLHQTLLTLTIVGYTAGAMTTLSVFMPSFLALIIPSLIPLIIFTLKLGGEVNAGIAFMLVVFMAFITSASRRQKDVLVTALKLRYENEALISNLQQEKEFSEKLNSTLGEKIEEQKITAYQLINARKQAELSSVAKSQFLANMSHEIRTPMNAIIGMSHLALQTELNRKQYNYIDKVNRSANSLLGIINDILDFSKIESGKLEMEHIDFSLEEVLDDLSSLLVLKTEEKELEILFDVAMDVPDALIGDPLRLKQVLINLCNNAVKFTEQGEVILRIEALEQNDNEVKLHFSVKDTGVGLTSEQQKGLFHSFSQADTSITRKYGGSGLGLAISKKLVEMMDGDISVESEPDVGSTFHFTIKLAKKTDIVPEPRSIIEEDSLNVLVVDDNASSREILCKVLSNFGFEVDQVDSGLEALKLLEQKKVYYKLVLIDWKMPEMDGFETIRAFQADKEMKEILTVIMITTYDRDEVKALSKGLDIRGFLTKPVTPSMLLDGIMRAMGKKVSKKTTFSHREQEVTNDIAKLSGARILLVEDNEINQDLAIELLTSVEMDVVLAKNGQEALNILQEEKFDGVLMDIQMPIMDGYTATKQLRLQEQFKELPILAMTANAIVGDREKALDAGMNDHIPKPFHPNQLFSTMSRWITPSKPSIKVKVKETKDESIIPELDGINTELGLQRTTGVPSFYLKILRKVYQVQTGFLEEFDAAIKAKDLELAHRLVHTLKGSAGSIGAEQLQRICQVIEEQTTTKSIVEVDYETLVFEINRLLKALEGI